MSWLIKFLTELIARLLPWIFSGTKTETIGRTDGLEGLDRNDVTGTEDLVPEALPDL